MSKEIREILQINEDYAIEEKESLGHSLGSLIYKWCIAGKENANKRKYSKKLLVREVDKMKKRLEKAKVAQNLDHTIDGNTSLKNVSHVLIDVWMNGNEAWAKSEILKTSSGRDLMRLIRSGVEMGSSLRGFGDVDNKGNVQDNFSLESIDLVSKPSFGADVALTKDNLMESGHQKVLSEAEKKRIERMAEEAKMKHFHRMWESDRKDRTFLGSFQDYLRWLNVEKKEGKKEVETEPELTAEQKKEIFNYNQYVASGGTKTKREWRKLIEPRPLPEQALREEYKEFVGTTMSKMSYGDWKTKIKKVAS